MPKEEKIRLGGMALANGVLVHGPTSWGCAIRAADGTIKVASRKKRVLGSKFRNPLLRGPARLADAFAIMPDVKRALPEAVLPFERGNVLRAMIASALAVNGVRRSRLGETAKEITVGLLTIAPAMLSLREGNVAAYHGAEHITIGTYEQGKPHAREHERCGTHLVGPLLATAAAGNALASRAPLRFRPAARSAAAVGALAASTELFSWMNRNPEHLLARALAKPGHEFQHRIATAEPSRDQLDVAEAALEACLALETADL